jgi:Glutamyl- and glutaminyl-tRNA synthetases
LICSAACAAGEFPDGAHVLRAKIDMASPNLNMRDPVLYRIRRARHHRTGDAWCIYPMYDYAHPISDALERITHSICTLEFEDHRPLYDWLIENLPLPGRPQQIEFARLNLTYTIMSKRRLLQLVTDKHVTGWDDPRMPTLSGLRRRGYTPEAIRAFCDEIGVAKRENVIDVGLLEYFVREDLNTRATRAMTVLRPLKIVLENYPDGLVEEMDVVNNPENPDEGTRKVPFSKVLYIEQDDFLEDPPKKFFRLAPGREVRLRNAYLITAARPSKTTRGAWSNCVVPTIRPRAAATRRTAARSRRRSTGCRPLTRSTPRSGCTIGCSVSKCRARATWIFSRSSIPSR